MKVVELFAGVGGFRLGLEKTSDKFDFVWANQWEPSRKTQHAYDCYIEHFGKNDSHINKDICTIDKNEIPNHELLVGGFPCQDYSVARTGAKGIEGIKGVLWWEIYEILKTKKPKFVLLENVDRLLKSPSSQRGRDFGVMLACFNEADYSVEWRVINAAEYGYPQKRRRVFIFAFKNDSKYAKNLNIEKPYEYIHKKGFFQNEFPILRKPIKQKIRKNSTYIEYDNIADVSDNFDFKFENSGIMSKKKIYTEQTFPNYNGEYLKLKDILDNDVDEKYYIDTDSNKLEKFKNAKAAKKINRVSKEGHEYVFAEGNLSFPDCTNTPARTMLTSESTVNRSSHVVEDPITKRLRILTPLEAERINGFEDNWTDTDMTERFRYFCMGNALVVGLIEQMGKILINIYNNETDNI